MKVEEVSGSSIWIEMIKVTSVNCNGMVQVKGVISFSSNSLILVTEAFIYNRNNALMGYFAWFNDNLRAGLEGIRD